MTPPPMAETPPGEPGCRSCLGCLGFAAVTLADLAAGSWAAAEGNLYVVAAAGALLFAILAAARRYRGIS